MGINVLGSKLSWVLENQAEDTARAQQQCWGPSTGSVLLSSVERRSADFQHGLWEELCQPWESEKDVGELASSLASAETLPLLSSAPCNSLGSSSTAWETVSVSSEVVASL